MLSRRTATAILLAAAVLLAVAPAPGVQAQEDCEFRSYTGPDGDEYMIWTCSDGWSGGGGDGEWVCTTNFEGRDIRVRCIDSVFGWFSTIRGGCYIRPKLPQPVADDPVWEGRDAADGLFYDARCFATEGVDGFPYVELPTSIFLENGASPVWDLVEEAIAKLPLRGADIHLAPDPAGVGLVGLPVWMWTPETDSTWGPARASASLPAFDITVWAEANAEHITWSMGDGTQVRCDSPGTPYEASYGAEESPTCGHVYDEPSRSRAGGRYPVTATTQWRIEWWIDETTARATIPATREATPVTVRINELQVVTS